jgi:orotidine-5'-phosphate decarboxylase
MLERPHFGERLAEALQAHGPLCLGIDPHAELLSIWNLPDTADGAREFGLRAIDAAVGSVGIVKPQVAFFERHGAAGIAALELVIARARSAGLLVIADAKRGDIGSTIAGYAHAWLSIGSPLESDAMTVVAYQGIGSLAPAFALAEAAGKGVFVLAATSNPEAAAIQSAITADGTTVAARILDETEALNRSVDDDGIGPFGVVIGATIDPAAFGIDLARSSTTPILAPGFGEQGALPSELGARYGAAAARVVANVSRGALRAGPDALPTALAALGEQFAIARAEVLT